MGKKCICQICECGRHRCPHKPRGVILKGDQPCNLTEYTNVYKQHPFQERKNFKPPNQPMESGDFKGVTTHRQDFIKHPLERPFVHQQEGYKQPQGNIDSTTSYTKDYTAKYGTPAKPIRHENKRQVEGKFDGTPTYKSDYRQWDMSGRQGPIMSQSAWEKPTARFEGESTMQKDYIAQYQAKRPLMKPAEAARMSDARFDDKTGYRDNYIQHPLEKRAQHQPDVYKGPTAAFDGVTTFQRDYKGPLGERTISFKPENRAFSSGVPLADNTTNRDDYKKWPLTRPFVHQQEGYKQPEGRMETETTHKKTFIEYPIKREIGKRPSSATKTKQVPFDGVTSYYSDYKPWEMGQRERGMNREQYQPTNAPFEGMSTQKAHYIPHSMQPRASFKPENAQVGSNAPFEDGTMYRTDYTKKQVTVCPAVQLDGPNASYTFQTTDNQGHRFYQPIIETITPLGQNKLAMSVA